MTQLYEAVVRCLDDSTIVGVGCAPEAYTAVANAFCSLRAARYAAGEYHVEVSLGDGQLDWLNRSLGSDVIGKLEMRP